MSAWLPRALRAPWIAIAVVLVLGMARVRRAVAGRHAKALLVESEQGRFLARPGDWTVGAALAYKGSYGTAEIARLLAGLVFSKS